VGASGQPFEVLGPLPFSFWFSLGFGRNYCLPCFHANRNNEMLFVAFFLSLNLVPSFSSAIQ
jgi:hypothetical protein